MSTEVYYTPFIFLGNSFILELETSVCEQNYHPYQCQSWMSTPYQWKHTDNLQYHCSQKSNTQHKIIICDGILTKSYCFGSSKPYREVVVPSWAWRTIFSSTVCVDPDLNTKQWMKIQMFHMKGNKEDPKHYNFSQKKKKKKTKCLDEL